MSSRIAIALLFLLALPVSAQVEPAATGPISQDEDLRMMLPPPVSNAPYPRVTGSEERSNYLRGGIGFDTAYIDNVFSGEFTRQLHETTLTVKPNIALDRTTPRHRETFSYTPGFTFYRPTSELDAIDQNANLEFEYRFARYTALDVTDTFLQTTNPFGDAGAVFAVGVSGSAGAPQVLIIPYAEQLSDTLQATFSHQYARNQMFGAGGSFRMLNYPNRSQAPGLYDSKSGGGSAFYAYRAGARHYLGITYQYSHIVASPTTGESDTDMQSILPYYTFYLGPTISVSLAAGPQYFKSTETGLPNVSGWTPVATASVARQTAQTNLAIGYARTVSGGGGLLGAFKQDSGELSARGQLTRYWAVGAEGNYMNVTTATPGISANNQGGHQFSVKGLIQRALGERFYVELGYVRLHQDYRGVSLLNNNPDSNRGYLSLNYQFARPIGR